MHSITRAIGITLFLLLAALVVAQLFVPPITGLANNGDYERVMCYAGLEAAPQYRDAPYFAWLNTQYAFNRATWTPFWYVTSQGLLVWAAAAAKWLTRGGAPFDIRWMGALHALLFLLGVAVIFRALARLHPLVTAVAGLLLVAVACDAGYLVYFNSFYSEPGAYVFLYLLAGVILTLLLRDPAARERRVLLIAYTVLAALLVTSKAQYVFLGLPLAVFGWLLARQAPEGSGPPPRRRGLGLAALLLAVSGAYYLFGRPAEVVQCNLYHMVFLEILPHSPAPSRDLADLGLDAKYAALSGTTWFTPGVPVKTPAFQADFFGRIGYGTVLRFFLTHPARVWSRLQREGPSVFSLRPAYLGNYERSAGKPPYAKSWHFSAWSSWKESLPAKNSLLAVFVLLNAAALLLKWRAFDRTAADRRLTGLHLLLFVMCGLEFVMVLLGDGGGETVKHMHLASALFDLCLLYMAVALAAGIAARLSGRRPAERA